MPPQKSNSFGNIFNACLRLSYFPILWKFSKIVLFPKPNKPLVDPSSYRPISLLPFLAKILERLILKRMIPYIIRNNILPNTQFGFRSSHSTIHQAHRIVDAISLSLEKNFTVPVSSLMYPKRSTEFGMMDYFLNSKAFYPTRSFS